MKAIERYATKVHKCECGCGRNINPGDKMYEVTYKLQGKFWYSEYYFYEHW